MSRGIGRHRSSSSHDSNFRQHFAENRVRDRERERDYPAFRHNARSSAERERQERHRRTFSAPGRNEPHASRSDVSERRDSRPMPLSAMPPGQGRIFDPTTRGSMYQLRVCNLFVKRGHIDDRQLRHQVHQHFSRFGKCSLFMDTPVPGEDSREAYITYYSLESSKAARHESDGMSMNGRRLDVTVMREPRIFQAAASDDVRSRSGSGYTSHSPSRSDSRKDSIASTVPSGMARPTHGPPQKDDPATRTLFVGSLPAGISVQRVKDHFARIGPVHDIDVKRSPRGAAYAFVKFVHMRDARRAKLELQGSLINKSRIHLGYGRGTPSNRVYAYNLGRWATKDVLERAFSRLGPLRSMDYRAGSTFAIVEFKQGESSKSALRMRRIAAADGKEYPLAVSYIDAMDLTVMFRDHGHANHNATSNSRTGENSHFTADTGGKDSRRSASRSREDVQLPIRGYHHSDERTSRGSLKRAHSEEHDEGAKKLCEGTSATESMSDISRRCPVVWRGSLVLRNSCCPLRLHTLGGDATLVDDLLGGTRMPRLVLSQKMVLEPTKLDEVMGSVGGCRHCWLLGVPTGRHETEALQSQLQGVASNDPSTDLPNASNMTAAKSESDAVADVKSLTGAAGTGAVTSSTGQASCSTDAGGESHSHHVPSAVPARDDDTQGGQLPCTSSSSLHGPLSQRPVQPLCRWRSMLNFVDYMRAKQCAGICHISALPSPDGAPVVKEELTQASPLTAGGVLHTFPPSDFADEQMAQLVPSLSTPVDGMLLCLLTVVPNDRFSNFR